MRKLWVFGDSFFHYNSNWITTLARRLDIDTVKLHSWGGTGLVFTARMLSMTMQHIHEDDLVLIGLSHPHRHEFNWWHVRPHDFEKKKKFFRHPLKINRQASEKPTEITKEEYQAAKDYFTYLFDEQESRLIGRAVASFIINDIVSFIPTERVAIIRTLGDPSSLLASSVPLKYNHLLNSENNLWTIMSDFLKEHYNIPIKQVHKADQIYGENHWIDHKEYEKFFFDRVDHMLKPLFL